MDGKKEKTGSGLTVKREAFVRALARGEDRASAYRAAFDCAGRSDAAAAAAAARLLALPAVQARYAALCAADAEAAPCAGENAQAQRGETQREETCAGAAEPPGTAPQVQTPNEAALAARLLEELAAMAFGEREYPEADRGGHMELRPAGAAQRLKAMELLGKRLGLFSGGAEGAQDGALDVCIRVVE